MASRLINTGRDHLMKIKRRGIFLLLKSRDVLHMSVNHSSVHHLEIWRQTAHEIFMTASSTKYDRDQGRGYHYISSEQAFCHPSVLYFTNTALLMKQHTELILIETVLLTTNYRIHAHCKLQYLINAFHGYYSSLRARIHLSHTGWRGIQGWVK